QEQHPQGRGAGVSRARHGSDLAHRGRELPGLHRHRRQGQRLLQRAEDLVPTQAELMARLAPWAALAPSVTLYVIDSPHRDGTIAIFADIEPATMPDRLWWIAEHGNGLPHLPDDLRGSVTATVSVDPDKATAIRTAARHSDDWRDNIVCVALTR